MDLEKHMDKRVRVKFAGGREGACVSRGGGFPLFRAQSSARSPSPPHPTSPARAVIGTLKGFDGLVNIVLDDCTEYLRDPKDLTRLLDPPVIRPLGLVVCRGTNVFVLMPEDGFSQIQNPFLAGGEEGEQ